MIREIDRNLGCDTRVTRKNIKPKNLKNSKTKKFKKDRKQQEIEKHHTIYKSTHKY